MSDLSKVWITVEGMFEGNVAQFEDCFGGFGSDLASVEELAAEVAWFADSNDCDYTVEVKDD